MEKMEAESVCFVWQRQKSEWWKEFPILYPLQIPFTKYANFKKDPHFLLKTK